MSRPQISVEAKDTIRQMLGDGYTLRTIAEKTGVSLRTVQRYTESMTVHEHQWEIAGVVTDDPAVIQSCVCGAAQLVPARRRAVGLRAAAEQVVVEADKTHIIHDTAYDNVADAIMTLASVLNPVAP